MSSAQFDLQKAIFDALKASAFVMALVDGVYDSVPSGAFKTKNAYISFGASDVVDDDADCILGGEHTLQLDIWSRNVGAAPCKKIVDAVKAALHEVPLTLAETALVELRCTLRRVFLDPDGVTYHGVVQLAASIEE